MVKMFSHRLLFKELFRPIVFFTIENVCHKKGMEILCESYGQ